jgi:hypothetical protein
MEQRTKPRTDQLVGGAVLIGIGVLVLLGQYFEDFSRFFMLVLGVGLLVIYAITRNAGTLIAGGIITGLGLGIVLADTYFADEVAAAAIVLGLGGGFIGVWLVGTFMHEPATRLWPLIPGSILVAVGALLLSGVENLEQYQWIGPAILIGLGLLVLVAAVRRRPETPPAATEPESTDVPT